MTTTRGEPADWLTCRVCEEEWPASCFNASGTANRAGWKICNACYHERYRQRAVECSRCKRKFRTRGKGEPVCRACREVVRGRELAAATPPLCIACGVSATEVRFVGAKCHPCYDRARARAA